MSMMTNFHIYLFDSNDVVLDRVENKNKVVVLLKEIGQRRLTVFQKIPNQNHVAPWFYLDSPN
jgi:hypothetical protein